MTSRLALAGLLALLLAAPVLAQDAKESNEQKRDKKLAEEWLRKPAAWITDYDEARKAAKDGKKLIFGYFTRSYAF